MEDMEDGMGLFCLAAGGSLLRNKSSGREERYIIVSFYYSHKYLVDTYRYTAISPLAVT
jgi:hypothetical protein